MGDIGGVHSGNVAPHLHEHVIGHLVGAVGLERAARYSQRQDRHFVVGSAGRERRCRRYSGAFDQERHECLVLHRLHPCDREVGAGVPIPHRPPCFGPELRVAGVPSVGLHLDWDAIGAAAAQEANTPRLAGCRCEVGHRYAEAVEGTCHLFDVRKSARRSEDHLDRRRGKRPDGERRDRIAGETEFEDKTGEPAEKDHRRTEPPQRSRHVGGSGEHGCGDHGHAKDGEERFGLCGAELGEQRRPGPLPPSHRDHRDDYRERNRCQHVARSSGVLPEANHEGNDDSQGVDACDPVGRPEDDLRPSRQGAGDGGDRRLQGRQSYELDGRHDEYDERDGGSHGVSSPADPRLALGREEPAGSVHHRPPSSWGAATSARSLPDSVCVASPGRERPQPLHHAQLTAPRGMMITQLKTR